MQKKINGLVIGKFYPPHEGHHHLISVAENHCDKLDVIVCEREWEKEMPGELRASWIRKRHPDARIHLLRYSDDETDASSEFWARKTTEFLGYAPDIVFTSESYGEPYTKLLGACHVEVDKARTTFPVSGTKVRDNPYQYWNLIDESVRSFYAARVVILGAESTGKSTLAADLANALNTVWVPEFGRIYYDGKLNTNWTSDDFEFIAKSQHVFEDQMAGKSNKVVFCDTDAVATYLWENALAGTSRLKISDYVRNFERRLYILCDTDIPFTQDGTRDEKRRLKMQEDYVKLLKKLKIPYILASGSREDRVKVVVQEIKKHPAVAGCV